MADFEPVIGLEVHAELLTRAKMFCRCAVVDTLDAAPNSAVCEVCSGMPGTLPVINARAVEFALRVALALECEVATRSLFARKNYFYPDLPKGYQISQYEMPLAVNGRLVVDGEEGAVAIGIRRVHLEEDTGKLFHHDGYSLIDFNRAGVPLLEIVSEPDLHSVADAATYATDLRNLLRYLGVNSGDMEKGVIRFEANVSVRRRGQSGLGKRVEIKNLNSFRAMRRALEHEVERQQALVAAGDQVTQQTLGWDERTGETVPQRGKEEAEDYRYFPEPDLPPLVVDQAWIDEIQSTLPELPRAKRQRFIDQFELTPYAGEVLTSDAYVAQYFEDAVGSTDADPALVANWLSGDLFALLNARGLSLEAADYPARHLAQLVGLVSAGKINATTAKQVLSDSFAMGKSPLELVRSGGLEQERDRERLLKHVRQVLDDNPNQLDEYLSGKDGLANWFFGQVMAATDGRADPALLRQLLIEILSERSTQETE